MTVAGKTALITGITGQDGSYLAEFLLERDYDVHGVTRRTSAFNRARIDALRRRSMHNGRKFELHYGDLGDASSLNAIVARTRPDEVYNLAAQSHVGISFMQPEYTTDVVATGALRLLETIRSCGLPTRFYQASTSELFGNTPVSPQNETAPFVPQSPYAISKLYSYWIVRLYRTAYKMFAVNGILFNHESPRRGENFVTRKITLTLAQICAGDDVTVRLGNLDARRDWGYAGDYIEAMWLMLQQEEPGEYVIATGQTHSVREFAERAAQVAGFDLEWEGSGLEEVGRDRRSGRLIVEIDPQYHRPADVQVLVGDARHARETLNWRPRVSFDELVEMMMKADLEACGAVSAAPSQIWQPASRVTAAQHLDGRTA